MAKSKKRHFDNKADLINTLKTNKRKQEYSSAAAFSANMLMSLYVLREGFGFGQGRAERFIDGMKDINDKIESGELTIDDIENHLLNTIGVMVELPK